MPVLSLWRVSNHATLDGVGGLLASGRWHSKGRLVLYCSPDPSTALLESLVHFEIDAEDRPERFQALRIEVPETLSRELLDATKLPSDWRENQPATQAVGDAWLASRRSLLLEVPSALVPETWNVLVNPAHREAKRLKIAKVYRHPFDARLVR